MTASKAKVPRRKKRGKRETLPLFPVRAPDALAEPHWRDQLTYEQGWVCFRCGQQKKNDYRTAMVFHGTEGRESAGTPICTTCAMVIQVCLERGTEQTPIVAPVRERESTVAPAKEHVHPWDAD